MSMTLTETRMKLAELVPPPTPTKSVDAIRKELGLKPHPKPPRRREKPRPDPVAILQQEVAELENRLAKKDVERVRAVKQARTTAYREGQVDSSQAAIRREKRVKTETDAAITRAEEERKERTRMTQNAWTLSGKVVMGTIVKERAAKVGLAEELVHFLLEDVWTWL